jgi:hypothetical protein
MRAAVFVFFAVLALAWGIQYERSHPVSTTASSHVTTAVFASPEATGTPATQAIPDSPFTPAPRTKTAGCIASGGLPDPACTPGAIFKTATSGVICVQGYSETVRSVTVATKRAIYAEYGLSYPQKSGAYEADHFIPLELAGANDIANLFPEAASPTPGFHEKDLVENYLHNQVCAGDMPLSAAQREIATNWLAVWHSLTPADIAALKAQAASYGD